VPADGLTAASRKQDFGTSIGQLCDNATPPGLCQESDKVSGFDALQMADGMEQFPSRAFGHRHHMVYLAAGPAG
jgi:hypothetical protein